MEWTRRRAWFGIGLVSVLSAIATIFALAAPGNADSQLARPQTARDYLAAARTHDRAALEYLRKGRALEIAVNAVRNSQSDLAAALDTLGAAELGRDATLAVRQRLSAAAQVQGAALRNPGSRRKFAKAIGIALSDEIKAAGLLGDAPTEPTIVEQPIPLRAFGAFDLRLAHDGHSVWVSGSDVSRILLYSALGTGIAPTVFKLPPGSFPHAIAVGPDDALYVAETGTNIGGNAIGRLTASGQYRQYPLPARAGGPWGVTVGPDHEIWFTEVGAGKVGRLDPTSGDLVEFSLRTPDSQPQGIVMGPDGALWGTEVAANQIFRITADGHVSEFRIPTPHSLPVSITAGRGGVLWVSEFDAGKLLRISPPNRTREFALPSGGRPYGLMSAPDGNVWFADRGRNRIGLVTPAGRIFEFGLPTENAQPIAIVPVGLGKFAFVEFVGNQIGTLDF